MAARAASRHLRHRCRTSTVLMPPGPCYHVPCQHHVGLATSCSTAVLQCHMCCQRDAVQAGAIIYIVAPDGAHGLRAKAGAPFLSFFLSFLMPCTTFYKHTSGTGTLCCSVPVPQPHSIASCHTHTAGPMLQCPKVTSRIRHQPTATTMSQCSVSQDRTCRQPPSLSIPLQDLGCSDATRAMLPCSMYSMSAPYHLGTLMLH
jgi:hypothetical protein